MLLVLRSSIYGVLSGLVSHGFLQYIVYPDILSPIGRIKIVYISFAMVVLQPWPPHVVQLIGRVPYLNIPLEHVRDLTLQYLGNSGIVNTYFSANLFVGCPDSVTIKVRMVIETLFMPLFGYSVENRSSIRIMACNSSL